MSFLKDRGAGSLGDPSGIWVSDDDTKYVADMQRRQVVAYDRDDRFVRAYGGKGLFEKPVDVAVFEKRVYVIDMKKHSLFILNRDSGGLIKTVGGKGRGEGEFFRPTHVTVDFLGNVFVTDAFNFRIQEFSPDGRFMKIIGFHGDRLGGFARPKGLAADKQDNLYAVDAAFENVQIFDKKGQLLLFFG
ncbi:MAG: 6-bladed beta-propeller, partial [Deltaproteobacteria bacterium]|nr:6-bladed beta-propeller [Deltaproteobacteria bacterium]